MGQALYRKYRSKALNEVVGQEHVTQTIEKALKSGKLSHAYLFTGPRGVGKTSVARILAHEVNNLPYNDDSFHLDIIEIDAASNRRIDEIRDLRDKVNISPTSAKYKVYIIDEVHMLTREAFNALLKTLEEPPQHCIFILATTEAHKLPETIVSRTQRFNFKPVSKKDVSSHLKSLAKQEKIEITPEALDLLAEHGQGSFRDSISFLDQLASRNETINDSTVRSLLGLPSSSAITEILTKISAGDGIGVLQALEKLDDQGANPVIIARELATGLRNRLIKGAHESWITDLLSQLIDVASSPYPRDKLEVHLLEACSKNHDDSRPSSGSKDSRADHAEHASVKKSPQEKIESQPDKIEAVIVTQRITSLNAETWPKVTDYVKNHAASIYTALRLARPSFGSGNLTLYFQFPLHQKKVNQTKHRLTVERAIEDICGEKVKVECIVDKEKFGEEIKIDLLPKMAQIETIPATTQLHAISNIFGNTEVLES